MITNKKFAAGIDIGAEAVQISYLLEGMNEPEGVGEFLSPPEETEEGLSAFIEKVREALLAVPGFDEPAQIDALDLAFSVLEKERAEKYTSCFAKSGVKRECIHAESYAEYAIYFALSQPRELWQNDVVFVDFSKEGFFFRRLHIKKEGKQLLVLMEEQEDTDFLKMELLLEEDGRKMADELFLARMQERFGKRLISAVYLIGTGFYGEDWAFQTLKFLCSRRRVFKGLNLYTKGACFAAYDRIGNKAFQAYTFLCSNRIAYSVGVRVMHKEEPKLLFLAKAGENWYETKACIECILNGAEEIPIVILPVEGREERTILLSLENFPKREDRMTRVEITCTFVNQESVVVQIKDLGFGSFVRATDMKVRKEISLKEKAE